MPSENPITGISLGTLNVNDTYTIGFDVTIIGMPPSDDFFVNRGNVSFVYSACVANINTLNDSNIAVILLSDDPPAPTDFSGHLNKCKFLNKTLYSLQATWAPVPLPVLVPYEIFKNGKLVDTIASTGPYVFTTCLDSKSSADDYTIIVNYGPGQESIPLQIRIN